MTIVSIELPEDQIVKMVEQLSATAKRAVLKRLLVEDERWEAMKSYGEAQIRLICAERGLDWDVLDEAKRLQLIDEILHQS
jgi:hypothetical protein